MHNYVKIIFLQGPLFMSLSGKGTNIYNSCSFILNIHLILVYNQIFYRLHM